MGSYWIVLIQAIAGSAFTGQIGTTVASALAGNRATSLATVQSLVLANINDIVAKVEKQLGASSVFLAIALAVEQTQFDNWINGLIATAYNKEISQLAGTANGTAISAAAEATEGATEAATEEPAAAAA